MKKITTPILMKDADYGKFKIIARKKGLKIQHYLGQLIVAEIERNTHLLEDNA